MMRSAEPFEVRPEAASKSNTESMIVEKSRNRGAQAFVGLGTFDLRSGILEVLIVSHSLISIHLHKSFICVAIDLSSGMKVG